MHASFFALFVAATLVVARITDVHFEPIGSVAIRLTWEDTDKSVYQVRRWASAVDRRDATLLPQCVNITRRECVDGSESDPLSDECYFYEVFSQGSLSRGARIRACPASVVDETKTARVQRHLFAANESVEDENKTLFDYINLGEYYTGPTPAPTPVGATKPPKPSKTTTAPGATWAPTPTNRMSQCDWNDLRCYRAQHLGIVHSSFFWIMFAGTAIFLALLGVCVWRTLYACLCVPVNYILVNNASAMLQTQDFAMPSQW